MKECVYCGKEINGNGVYFCEKCIANIKERGYIHTGKVIGDWVIAAYLYLEENNGNYWRNLRDFKDSPKEEQELIGKFNFIRPIDYIRFDEYRKALGVNEKEFAMSAENLNKMEKWYLELAEKERKNDR